MVTLETNAKTDNSMQMNNSFYAEAESKTPTRACMMLETMRQKIMMLHYELDSAKISSYDAKDDPTIHWTVKVEKDCKVKVLEGKIEILEKMVKEFENMPLSQMS